MICRHNYVFSDGDPDTANAIKGLSLLSSPALKPTLTLLYLPQLLPLVFLGSHPTFLQTFS